MATVGRAGYVGESLDAALFNYHIMRLRLEPGGIDPSYFLSYIRGSPAVTSYVDQVNHGQTRDGINTDQLVNMPVALPPFDEQSRIVGEVDTLITNITHLESSLGGQNNRNANLRMSILHQAFTGQLVPQDLDDEPASVLLERIKAERAAQGNGKTKRGRGREKAVEANKGAG